MDLQLYARVLWRFRLLVVGGLLLAVALAFFSYVDVKFDGGKPSFEYRQGEQWESLAQVGVGSRTFDPGSVLTPEIRSSLRPPAENTEQAREQLAQVDPSTLASFPRLMEITIQFLNLATGDAVMKIMNENGPPVRAALQTFPVLSGDAAVPFITFSAVAASPEVAQEAARRHVEAFKEFVTAQQNAAGIAENERVAITTVKQPQPAALLEGRKKTRPIIVFLAVMTAVIGLLFVLENLRPRVRTVPGRQVDEDEDERQRRRSA
jgi:hypothetical protein